MLILVTGVPGSGKTLYSVGLIRKFLDEKREVYADIDGLTLPGVLPAPDDWRECPDGSVVVYDECQQKFGPDGAGRSSRADIQEFETHRHRGMDILLITQHPKLLHAHIRRLIGRHYHVLRMYGAETAKIFRRDGQIDVDKTATLRDQDSFMWTYPKTDYNFYKSATVHTHKRQLPAWLKRSALGLLCCVVLVGFLGYNARGFFTGQLYASEPDPELTKAQPSDYHFQEISEPLPDNAPILTNDTIQTVKLSPVNGCAAAPALKKCRCVDHDSKWLNLTYEQCIDLATQTFRDSKIWD